MAAHPALDTRLLIGRTLVRPVEQEAVEAALDWLKTANAQVTIRQRPAFAEWAIAEAKTLHGLRGAVCRGLEKVRIQALLVATVQNVKRLTRGRLVEHQAAVRYVIHRLLQRLPGQPVVPQAC